MVNVSDIVLSIFKTLFNFLHLLLDKFSVELFVHSFIVFNINLVNVYLCIELCDDSVEFINISVELSDIVFKSLDLLLFR